MKMRVEPLRAGLAILTTLGLVIAMTMVVGGAPAMGQQGNEVCPQNTGGWSGHFNDDPRTVSGVWGQIQMSGDTEAEELLTATINAGYVVEICVKQATQTHIAQYGQGSHTVWQGDLSHWSYRVVQVPGDTTVPTTTPTTSPTTTPTTSTPTTSTPTTSTPTTSTPTTSTSTTSTPTTTPTSTPTTAAGTGNIVVAKQVAQGDPQNVAFNFTTTGFTLDDSSLAHGESGSAAVAAGGPYAVSESVLTGWQQVSATCDSTDQADDSTPADINVSPGETVTCTFVNQVPDDVLGTVITTVPDEVKGTTIEAEELPFTGIDGDRLLALAVFLLAGGLVVLAVTGRREEA